MANGIAQKAIALVLELAKHNRLDPIDLNGHGETTFREGWTDICFALIERGVRVRITSNFAKSFDETELEALASMDEIAISIDTMDPKLLRDVRRKVDLRQIVTNVAFVRATAPRLHRRPPAFAFLRILRSISPPSDFDTAGYLEANPDVKSAAQDPVDHFMRWGRLEGRPLMATDADQHREAGK